MIMKTNLNLIAILVLILILSALANLCVERLSFHTFPEKADMASQKVENSWDKTVADVILKIFIPKWQEEILEQERIIRINPDDTKKVTTAYLKIAEIYEKNKKFDKARETCEKILRDYPDIPLRKDAYLRLASIYEKEGRFDKVREMNELVIQEFPDDAELVKAEMQSIISYEKEEKYQEAILGYKKFLSKYPKTKERDYLNFKIGLLYRKLGEIDKAKKFYKDLTWDRESSWGENIRAEIYLSSGEGEIKKKVIYAKRITAPPKIDGHLNDPAWLEADKVTGFVDYQKDIPVTQQTTASVVYDEKKLYIGFICMEPDTAGLVAKRTERDTDVWSDDCVEVFMDTKRDYSTYFQLIANPIGAKYDGDGLNKDSWNPEWEVATAIGENYWNVELAIGFKELRASTPQVNDVWGFNLTRARRAGELEIGNWSFTDGSHHRPEKFGYLFFK